MTLLEAVNLTLRSLGESNVAALNSAHPKIASILSEIDTVSQRMQRRGWWFNTAERILEPETAGPNAGKVDASAYDAVVPVMRSQDYFPQAGFMIDRADGSFVGQAFKAVVRWSYPTTENDWANMPDAFTDYVAAEAALSFASSYDADELQLRKLQLQLNAARTSANADHVRYSRVNLFTSGSAGPAISRAWGRRYGIYR